MEITHNKNEIDATRNTITHFLTIDGKDEQMTLFVPRDPPMTPDTFFKSGLVFPLHYTMLTVEPFLRLLAPLIGSRKYKLIDNGHEQVAWFGGFVSG